MATPAALTDGIVYANSIVMPTANADTDLGTPIPVAYNQAALAEVFLTIAGGPATNSTFVVMQTDMGDGNWIDVAWMVTTATANGTLIFFLSGGVAGAGAFQQTRVAGAAPASNNANQMPLGGRIRFVGKTALTGGATPTVTARVVVKPMGLS
jgi:hypothetical protein